MKAYTHIYKVLVGPMVVMTVSVSSNFSRTSKIKLNRITQLSFDLMNSRLTTLQGKQSFEKYEIYGVFIMSQSPPTAESHRCMKFQGSDHIEQSQSKDSRKGMEG